MAHRYLDYSRDELAVRSIIVPPTLSCRIRSYSARFVKRYFPQIDSVHDVVSYETNRFTSVVSMRALALNGTRSLSVRPK